VSALPDLLYVVLFAAVFPVLDYLVFWPAFRRRLHVDPARARTWLWAWSIAGAWPVVAVGAVLWETNHRSWTEFGLAVPVGWRLWASGFLFALTAAYFLYAALALAGNADARAAVRQQFGRLADVLPHTRTELSWFAGVSLTAGFCEEFLFRGYFILVVGPWMGWWGAAALSVVIFALGHAYQGWSGALRTGVVAVLFTLLVATFDSLWPAIAVHTLWDFGQGCIAWLVLREGIVDAEPAGPRPESPPASPSLP
jgi:membrane protease YdiL (CAAX protease family)